VIKLLFSPLFCSVSTAIFLPFLASGQIGAATDDFESPVYTTVEYGDNGGTGFGPLTYLEGTNGGIFGETGARIISGTRSLGIFAADGGQALSRSVDTPFSIGTYLLSGRFDLSNEVGFSGFNLKSSQGGTFGADELIAFGLSPVAGHNSIAVFGAEDLTINLVSDLRGPIVDLRLDFNTLLGTYTLGAKLSTDVNYTTVSGSLKDTNGILPGTGAVSHAGYANFNTGGNQNLYADNVVLVPEPSVSVLFASSALATLFLLRRRRRF